MQALGGQSRRAVVGILRRERSAILSCWERAVRELPSARKLSRPALLDYVAPLVDDLMDEIDDRLARRPPLPRTYALEAHAKDRVDDGFDVHEVVAELGVLRDCMFNAWIGANVPLEPEAVRAVNQVVDKMLTVTVTYHVKRTTERERSNVELAKVADHFLSEATKALSASLEPSSTLAEVATLAIPDFADLCCVDLEKEGVLQRIAWAHRDQAKKALMDELFASETPPTFPLMMVAEAIRSGKTKLLVVDPTHLEAHTTADARLLQTLRPHSMLVVPLVMKDRRLGAFTFCSSESGRTYDESHVRLFEELAYRAASTLENARLYDEAKRAIANRDEILGVVAHDLKTPLSTVLLATHVLTNLEQIKLESPSARKQIEVIHRAATRMNRLIGDLLDLANIQAGHLSIERQPTDPRTIVEEALETHTPVAQAKGLELTHEAGVRLASISCDRDRILQVLSNLIDNAIKATPAGGTITIGLHRERDDVVFCVDDTGSGIAPEDLERIFERYWRGDHSGASGTGRGLAIAKGIIEAHGGRLWAESTLGVGSTFKFTIPVDEGQNGVMP
jgi:signal transduction histidine kinase